MEIVNYLEAKWKENLGRFEVVGTRSAKKPHFTVIIQYSAVSWVSSVCLGFSLVPGLLAIEFLWACVIPQV